MVKRKPKVTTASRLVKPPAEPRSEAMVSSLEVLFGKHAALPGNSTRAVGFVRVSKDEQHLSVQVQTSALVKYAETHGLELVEIFVEEGVSGAAPLNERTQVLSSLVALRERKCGVLLTLRRDRLARDVGSACMVERLAGMYGGRILCTDGTANDDSASSALMRGMMDLFAQYERTLIALRTKAALAVKREAGQQVGSIPYGARLVDGKVQRDERECRACALARQYVVDEGLSYRVVAQRLLVEGYVSRTGKVFHAEQVARMVAVAPLVADKRRWNEYLTKNKWGVRKDAKKEAA